VGGAKLETVERGGWEKYHPQRVFGFIQRYMEKDAERTSHWFDLEPSFALDCLLIGEGDAQCLYIVTTAAPPEFAWIHDRWPLVRPIV
jgi:putative SOS response-associated peptidase YedK